MIISYSLQMSTLISEFVPLIFEGVHPSWKNLFMSKEFKPIISSCIKNIGLDLEKKGVSHYDIKRNGLDTYIRPAPENIFEAFKYFDINNLRAVIVGQDPYPHLEDAMGMSFSTRHDLEKVPKSLGVIYDCWIKHGYMISKPKHGSLVNIASQGVLFLNRYLTRTPNIKVSSSGGSYVNGNDDGDSKAKFMHKFWAEFTDKLILYLCTTFISKSNVVNRPPLAIMLWGAHAQNLTKIIPQKSMDNECVQVMEWCHPVAMIGKKDPGHFQNCDHFEIINNILKSANIKRIKWDPDYKHNYNTKDQFLTMRMMNTMSADSTVLTSDEKETIAKLFKSGAAYNDGTDTAANKYIRLLKESQRPKPEIRKEPSSPSPPSPPDIDRIVVFTDGACPGNGKANPKGGWAVWFPSEYDSFINGIVPDDEEVPNHRAVYGKLPTRMLVMNTADRSIKYAESNKTIVKCTNQRAELLAVIHAIEKIIQSYNKHHIPKAVLIVPDNEYVIWWITELLWKYKAVDSTFKTVKANRDLIILLYRSLAALSKILPTSGTYETMEENLLGPEALSAWKKFFATKGKRTPPLSDGEWNGLTIIHQNSHLTGSNIPDTGSLEWERYIGNSKADEYANKAVALEDPDDMAQIIEKIEPTEIA